MTPTQVGVTDFVKWSKVRCDLHFSGEWLYQSELIQARLMQFLLENQMEYKWKPLVL
jgi:hypothetical protein